MKQTHIDVGLPDPTRCTRCHATLNLVRAYPWDASPDAFNNGLCQACVLDAIGVRPHAAKTTAAPSLFEPRAVVVRRD